MDPARKLDRDMMLNMPSEKLIDLFFLQMRNLWTVDGLYFLGIENKFDTASATEIDKNVWEVMGKIEARRIKETFGIQKNDIHAVIEALKLTSWSLDLENKEIIEEENRALFRNTDCRVQKTRLSKGLSEFPCNNVRWGYLKNFVKEFNEDIIVNCNVCPPGKHQENLWCEWEFKIK
ncbi:MAG: hypothetical protein JSW00_09385 [Thermoplasmata archaeon]|nr:MAG: hypothetical protein JSW00_09385 [Thermoplasmata archaeon]